MATFASHFGTFVQRFRLITYKYFPLFAEAEITISISRFVASCLSDNFPFYIILFFLFFQFPDILRESCRVFLACISETCFMVAYTLFYFSFTYSNIFFFALVGRYGGFVHNAGQPALPVRRQGTIGLVPAIALVGFFRCFLLQ